MAVIPDWYDENISISALMGPCTCPGADYFTPIYTEENMSFLKENGIYVIAGPNWEADRAKIFDPVTGLVSL